MEIELDARFRSQGLGVAHCWAAWKGGGLTVSLSLYLAIYCSRAANSVCGIRLMSNGGGDVVVGCGVRAGGDPKVVFCERRNVE
jgi:hypothetical protein